jgi:hypothetical protein
VHAPLSFDSSVFKVLIEHWVHHKIDSVLFTLPPTHHPLVDKFLCPF